MTHFRTIRYCFFFFFAGLTMPFSYLSAAELPREPYHPPIGPLGIDRNVEKSPSIGGEDDMILEETELHGLLRKNGNPEQERLQGICEGAKGIDINAINHDYQSALDMALTTGEAYQYLASKGALPALHVAAIKDYQHIVRVCLRRRPKEVKLRDAKGMMALHHALAHGHMPVALILLRAGAPVRHEALDRRCCINT